MKKPYFLPPLLARVTLADAFRVSALRKFKDMKGTADYFKQLGVPLPGLMARFVATTEITCGSLLGAGLLTRAAALSLIPIMAVAILTARKNEVHSFSDLTGVFEFSYILMLGYLAVYGGGSVSLDALAGKVLEREELAQIEEFSRFLKAA
ncbi:MAG: DoxX family protein [Bdellovibrionota bacterium]